MFCAWFTPSRSRNATLGVGAAVLALGLARYDMVATNDGPHHLHAAVVAHRYGDSASRAAECFALNTPLTSRGAHELLRAALTVWDPMTAGRVVGVVIATLLGLAAGVFVATCRRRIDAWALLAVAVTFNSGLALGLAAYLLATALALLAGSLWQWRAAPPVPLAAGVATLAFVAATCHVVGAGAVFAGLVILTGVNERQRLAHLLVALTPSAALAWAASRTPLGAGWSFMLASPREVALATVPLHPLFGGTLLVLAAATALSGLAHRERRAAGAFALGLLLLTFTLPLHLGTWHYGGRRLLPAAIVFAMTAGPMRGRSEAPLIALAAALLLTLAAAFSRAAAEAASDTAAVVREIRHARGAAPLLRAGIQRMAPSAFAFAGVGAPRANFTALVASLHGGASLQGHQYRDGIHTVLLRCGPRRVPPGVDISANFTNRPLRAGDPYTAHVLTLASLTEGIAALVGPADMDYLEHQAGFVTEHRGAALYLGRRPSCSVELELHDVTRPVVVEVGFAPGREPVRSAIVPAGGQGGRVSGLPCGPMWLRLSPGARCADPAALRWRTSPAAPVARVRCDVVP